MTDHWSAYQAAVRDTVRSQWQERQLLLLWLGMVEATHRDRYTTEMLTTRLRLGNWSGRLVEKARHLAETADADALPD